MRTKLFYFTCTLLTLLIYLIPSNLTAQTKPDIEKLDDAVVLVMIYDYKGDFVGHGSGFIVDKKGTVVTNYHVVKAAYSLKVRVDNNGVKTDYDVENIISGDQSKDVAKIALKNSFGIVFPFLSLAKVPPAKGEECWTIGTPADPNYFNSVTEGIVSNIYPNGIELWTGKMLQVSAPFTHGSSGGALINKKGEVVGVTCGGQEDKNGARANINWAIWIGELNNLPIINKKSLVDPASIPCQLGFYTNSPYTGNVYLYIDGIYVGSFSKYFQNNYTPTCSEDGTITRNLYSGTHSYQGYFATTGQWYYGTVSLNPGQCQIYRVGGDTPTYTYDGSNTNIWGQTRKEIVDRGNYKWVIASGLSFVETGRGLPLPLFFERYLSEKYSLRANIQWISRGSDGGAGINYSNKYFGAGLDFKKIFPRPYRWNWFIAATCNYRSINIHHRIIETTSVTGGYVTVDKSYTENKNHLFSGFRFGGDRYTGEKLYITWDLGIGYHTFYKKISADMNVLFGYKF